MCGIAGILNLQAGEPVRAPELEALDEQRRFQVLLDGLLSVEKRDRRANMRACGQNPKSLDIGPRQIQEAMRFFKRGRHATPCPL